MHKIKLFNLAYQCFPLEEGRRASPRDLTYLKKYVKIDYRGTLIVIKCFHVFSALGPVYMIPPRRDGTFLSRLDGKLAKAGWRVYMDKYIAGMKPFKC